MFGIIISKTDEKNAQAISQPKCREMADCFIDGQQIRHIEPKTKDCWISTYIRCMNCLHVNGKFYTTPSSLTRDHYRIVRPDRSDRSNGWKECELYKNGEWVSIYNLPIIK